MAIAPEPGKTKCPTCSTAMVPVGVTYACVDAKQALPARPLAGPKASFSAQRRETGRRQLWTGSSTTWDIESRRNRDVG